MNRLRTAYANASLDASVAAASPHRLVMMLFQGARIALAHARRAIADGNVAARAHALTKAAVIIDSGLKASLDIKHGGPIAVQLDSLYEYMVLAIARANVDGDRAKVEEIDRLLAGLEESWREIGTTAPAASAPVAKAPTVPPARREPLTYGRA